MRSRSLVRGVLWLTATFGRGGAVGCHPGVEHADCAAIAPGTRLSSLTLLGPASINACRPVSGPMDEVEPLWCCTSGFPSDAGVADCRGYGYGLVDCTRLAPFEEWVASLVRGHR